MSLINPYCTGSCVAVNDEQLERVQAIMKEISIHDSALMRKDLRQVMDDLSAGKIFQMMDGVKIRK
jgi:hypothetical protein